MIDFINKVLFFIVGAWPVSIGILLIWLVAVVCRVWDERGTRTLFQTALSILKMAVIIILIASIAIAAARMIGTIKRDEKSRGKELMDGGGARVER